MEIPMGEDPLHNIRYLALECRELFETIWHDCQKSLVLWSTTVEALNPQEKLDSPFRFRSFNFASTRDDFDFWTEITGLQSPEPWSFDFKTEGTLDLSNEIASCLEMISRASWNG
jgi:hypothetical protein